MIASDLILSMLEINFCRYTLFRYKLLSCSERYWYRIDVPKCFPNVSKCFACDVTMQYTFHFRTLKLCIFPLLKPQADPIRRSNHFPWMEWQWRVKNVNELLDLRPPKFSIYKSRMFQFMVKIFCVEFQRFFMKFHKNVLPIHWKMCSWLKSENLY